MAAITPTAKYEGWNDEIKTVVVQGSANTGDTHDVKIDEAYADLREIFSATFSANNQTVDCTWSNTTGVVTVGTVSTGPVAGNLILRGR